MNWIFPFIVICYITRRPSIPHCMGRVFCCMICESFLVEFSLVNIPHSSIISCLNKNLHVCNYVLKKQHCSLRKKLFSFSILSHLMITHIDIRIYKKWYNINFVSASFFFYISLRFKRFVLFIWTESFASCYIILVWNVIVYISCYTWGCPMHIGMCTYFWEMVIMDTKY